MWDKKLSLRNGNKVTRSWIELYIITDSLGRVRDELELEVGNLYIKVLAKCLAEIENATVSAGYLKDFIFLKQISHTKKNYVTSITKN